MQKKANRYFIPIDGQAIEVSEEVYRAYYRPIWNTRYHAQKNGECRCTKAQIWKCDGICPGCPFYAARMTAAIIDPKLRHLAVEFIRIVLTGYRLLYRTRLVEFEIRESVNYREAAEHLVHELRTLAIDFEMFCGRLIGDVEKAALTDAVCVNEFDQRRAELPQEIVIGLA